MELSFDSMHISKGEKDSSDDGSSFSMDFVPPPMPVNLVNDEEENVETEVCDAMIKVGWDQETGDSTFAMVSKSKFNTKTRMNNELVDFLCALQDILRPHLVRAIDVGKSA